MKDGNDLLTASDVTSTLQQLRCAADDSARPEKTTKKRAKWRDDNDEDDAMELQREKDIQERDELAERLKKKDKERQRKIVDATSSAQQQDAMKRSTADNASQGELPGRICGVR